jgi:Na+-transporting NADH:ubiquinone oxidoreductase subunit NqrD
METQVLELTKALAWHAQLQTYLLIGLAVVTVAGFWAISRDLRELGRLANAITGRV